MPTVVVYLNKMAHSDLKKDAESLNITPNKRVTELVVEYLARKLVENNLAIDVEEGKKIYVGKGVSNDDI